MKVAVERCRGHGEALVVKIITGGECYVPTLGNTQIARKVQCMRKLIGVSHVLGVNLCRSVLTHDNSV